jgi:putative transposase
LVYHVLNRSVGKMKMFRQDKDFEAFESLLVGAHQRLPLRLLAYCVMGTHWHFVAWPREDGELTAFVRWLTHTHAMRWRVAHHTVGYGHLYRGRFKSFPVERDEHLLTVCRYVERNALTAGLVLRAELWRWGSLWARQAGPASLRTILSPGPVDRPANWLGQVNASLTGKELSQLRPCLDRGQPLGSARWFKRMVPHLGLEHTVRPEGRPKGTVVAAKTDA